MPAERKPKTLRVDISQLVTQQIELHQIIMKRSRDMSESKFMRRVRDEGLSFQEQLAYYERTLNNEKGKTRPSADYVEQLKERISKTKQLVRSDAFRKEYQASVQEYVSGNLSLQEHLGFLESELNTAIDPDLKDKINESITEVKKAQYNSKKAVIQNKVNFAKQDKTKEILDSTLTEVRIRRSEALESGDEEWASALNVSISSLEQMLATAVMEDEIADFVTRSVSSTNPLDKVNNFNTAIASADTDSPVRIGGQLYNSAKDYWESEKGLYFSTGQFGSEFQKHFKSKLDAIESASQEALPMELKRVKKELEIFANKKDLVIHKEDIQTEIDNVLGYGADMAGKNIVNQAYIDYDFAGAAKKLSEINKQVGIDMTDHYNNIIAKVSEINFNQAQQILDTATAYAERTGLSEEASLTYAIQNTPNLVFSPRDIAGTTPEDVARGAAGQESTVVAKDSVRVDSSTEVGGQTGQRQESAVGSFIKLPNNSTVYRVDAGNKITPLTGAWTEEDFRKLTGSGFDIVNTVSDLGTYQLNTEYKYSDKFGEKISDKGIVSSSFISQKEAEEDARQAAEAQKAKEAQKQQILQQNQQSGGGQTGAIQTTPPAAPAEPTPQTTKPKQAVGYSEQRAVELFGSTSGLVQVPGKRGWFEPDRV